MSGSAADPIADVRAAAAGALDAVSGAVVALVSGGRDSVCLLDVAVAQLGAARVRALHVNYALREGADGDEELCATLCELLGVALQVHRPSRPQEVPGNLQAWARDVRYGAAARLAISCDAVVLSGHTSSDQVETILYRLAASPGRRALLGMPSRHGLLLRPLLDVTREQTGGYCRARGMPFRDDPTNDAPTYARGRARAGLVPALRELHPAAESNLLRTASLLREEAAVLDELVAHTLQGRARISLERLAALPGALARLVVVRLAEDAAHAPAGGVADRLPQLLALEGRGGSVELHLGGGLRALVEYGVLRIVAGSPPAPPPAVALPLPGRVRFGDWEISCALAGVADEASARDEEPFALLDAEALGDQLVVRCWQAGDRIAPLGLTGTKTLSDLFVDRRVPRQARATLPLLTAGGVLAWIPGLAIDRRFATTPASDRVIALRARRHAAGAREAAGAPNMLSGRPPATPLMPRTDQTDPAIGDLLVSADDLQRRVRELAAEITRDYADRPLLLVGVLKGAVFFLSDLMRWIETPVEVDFMAVASYGSATDSSGVVRILKDLDVPIEDRDVLIVEDIIDSGLTLQYLWRNLHSRNPRSLEVCALLTKPARRRVDLPTRYVGFEIADRFAIGYGLDHAERYRNLPYVAALKR